ncbi:MAG: hypothetical protein IJT75_03605 [Bacteroidaceae bacterium]|nr:hypothetical protein [Bacteroidaceae bacterium]
MVCPRRKAADCGRGVQQSLPWRRPWLQLCSCGRTQTGWSRRLRPVGWGRRPPPVGEDRQPPPVGEDSGSPPV